jgi:hypothetical protein
MGQQRLTIPILGGIFFLIIVIGGAMRGDPSLLVAIVVTLPICLFAYWLRKRRSKEKEVGHLRDTRAVLSLFDRILIIIIGLFLAALPFFLGIFRWPWSRP